MSKKNDPTFSAKDVNYVKHNRPYQNKKKFQTKNSFQIPKGKTHIKNTVFMYGLHTVSAALNNPERKIIQLSATQNAMLRLKWTPSDDNHFPVKIISSKAIDEQLGRDTTHQGVMLETHPLPSRDIDSIKNCKLLIVLDQINDPHNVGAILRSAVAFECGAVITTRRYSPSESGTLAKSASGALELIPYIQVTNLSESLEELHKLGFQTIGLDSESPQSIESVFLGDKIAFVIGSEGKGLRQKIQKKVIAMARLNVPGAIKSLNVSNATAIALYTAHKFFN
ncbi:23S rRNA (guanosine-2'-O-)-methyltransferase rlmB [Liberibacter crescens BT-1]|uniref:23S rRNA (Guanosine-2'-O-)-methyltransferase rlmB n=1 Tax=Liberibacter crescens (strain BT-1) TaxID=1215343 RepID=L0EXQ2_LIBCB|nr:23S rRNA (guanosine(2251)-2'-O)-methyltransferase RlmB [Liberibacter crescens]AGA65151.1 23S rRNA (guanosine-2'-O-)-methyltransferase rlmB [Liberibacter crescens BT-1]AMC13116.1 RNA methyltransferase [Liberibacter crescens]